MDPEPVGGIGARIRPTLLLENYGGASQGWGDKYSFLWGLLSQRDVHSIWCIKGKEQASPQEKLSLVPSYLTSVPSNPAPR